MTVNKKIATAGISLLALAGVANTPMIPKDLTWVKSYETVKFDTASGDMEQGFYALAEDGTGYYVRQADDADKNQFVEVPLDFNISKLTEAHIIGKATYSEFTDESGKIVRESLPTQEYQKLSKQKNYPQPKKSILVTPAEDILHPAQAHAALAFDAANNSGWGTNVSSVSWSHTITGSNPTLLAVAYWADAGAKTVTAFTYNGSNLTNKASTTTTSLYFLAAPGNASSTVSITMSATTQQVLGGSVSYSGADQTTPIEATNTGGGSGTTTNVSVTTITDNANVIEFLREVSTQASYTKDATQTSNWNLGVSASQITLGESSRKTSNTTPAGSVTMAGTFAAARSWGKVVAVIKPDAGVPVVPIPSTHQVIITQ